MKKICTMLLEFGKVLNEFMNYLSEYFSMSIMRINSFLSGKWVPPGAGSRDICSAITGEKIAVVGNTDLDYISMLDFARKTCGPALRKLTFHDRARMLKGTCALFKRK